MFNEEWCTPSNLCGQNEGDCDVDEDCNAGLVCGVDNCFGVREFDIEGDADDCCVPEAAGVQLGEYQSSWIASLCSSELPNLTVKPGPIWLSLGCS